MTQEVQRISRGLRGAPSPPARTLPAAIMAIVVGGGDGEPTQVGLVLL
jgi:hypothetical protein